MPADSNAADVLAGVRAAKEAYLMALRRAFVEGLDPFVLVQAGVFNRAFQARPATDPTIDLTSEPEHADEQRRLEQRSPGRDSPIMEYIG